MDLFLMPLGVKNNKLPNLVSSLLSIISVRCGTIGHSCIGIEEYRI